MVEKADNNTLMTTNRYICYYKFSLNEKIAIVFKQRFYSFLLLLAFRSHFSKGKFLHFIYLFSVSLCHFDACVHCLRYSGRKFSKEVNLKWLSVKEKNLFYDDNHFLVGGLTSISFYASRIY